MREEDVGDPTFSGLLKLPLLHIPPNPIMQSPDHPSTPPLQAPASVPFRWEEEPGKPRSCTTHFTPLSQPTFKLELPPGSANKFTSTPSPTTVLDGPCNVGRPKFSSFRWFKDVQDYSYDTTSVVSSYYSPDGSVSVEELFGCKKEGHRRKGFFGRIKNGKKVVDGGSCRFSPSSVPNGVSDFDDNLGGSMRRNGSFSTVSNAKPSHFLVTIYQGLKQVIQWKSGRKSGKTEGSV